MRKMRKRVAVFMAALLIVAGAVGGTVAADIGGKQDAASNGALTAAELLENPVYDVVVTVEGKVSLLGELFCPCFELTSGGESIQVWYDLMVDEDGNERPPVSVDGINNGDWVIVTGELKPSDGLLPSKTFWATDIQKTQRVEPGMTEVPAPIHEVEIQIAESLPVQYFLRVVSGLQNSCVEFGSYNVTREGDVIRVEVVNLEPTDESTVCAQVYEFVEHTIPLGSAFIPGTTYTVLVNDVSKTFVAEGNGADVEEPSEAMVVAVGQVFEVPLESNLTTGYRWVANFDDALLELVDEQYEEDSDLIGAPGTQVFTFRALSTGRAEVTFDYMRPWETEVLETQTLTVDICASLD
jgi:predicted secreted protein